MHGLQYFLGHPILPIYKYKCSVLSNIVILSLKGPASKVCLYLCFQEPVFENVNLDTTIVRVKATDADSGLFADIEYSLVDGEGKFAIKPSTVS